MLFVGGGSIRHLMIVVLIGALGASSIYLV